MLLFSSFLFSFVYLRKTKKKKNKQTKKPHNVELKRVPPQKKEQWLAVNAKREREREKKRERERERGLQNT